MSSQIRIISSMATRQLLSELVAQYQQTSAQQIATESVGGVDAAKRVRAGEAFDAVVLAANAIDDLIAAGRIVAGSRVDLVRSGVAIAVRAPPGVPVGTLVARGEVELGFQQLSELIHLSGITVLGPLPPAIQTITTFSAGVASTSTQPEAVRALLRFMASPATTEPKLKNGMEPA